MIDMRCLDPTNTLGSIQVRQIYYQAGEDNVEFDRWYAGWIRNTTNILSAVAYLVANLLQYRLVVVYVGDDITHDMITESFIKYLVTEFGIKSLFIENAYSNVDEEIDSVNQDRFDDFSELGIESAKVLVDTFNPVIGVECTPQEIEMYGLRDNEYESIY